MTYRRRCRVGLQRPLTVCLPEAFDVPVPPKLAEMLGYPCVPPERYVCFYWSIIDEYSGPELMWFDGMLCQYADPAVWGEYVNYWFVDSVFSQYALGGPGENGVRASKDCLLLDTVENRLHIVPVERGCALARRTAGDAVCALPWAQQLEYMRVSHAVVSPPAHLMIQYVQESRAKRLADLQDWLNRNRVPF